MLLIQIKCNYDALSPVFLLFQLVLMSLMPSIVPGTLFGRLSRLQLSPLSTSQRLNIALHYDIPAISESLKHFL